MKNKLNAVCLFAFMVVTTGAFSQGALTIDKLPSPDGKTSIYIANRPIMLKESGEKSIMLAPKFSSDPKTGNLRAFEGLQLFATGLGECFFRDTLQLLFTTGKILKITSTSPMFCKQRLSDWYDLNKQDLTMLFSAPLIQINYKNGKTGETFNQDITENDLQQYFIELKKIFDTMVPPQKEE